MNILTKIEALMFAFLLCALVGSIINPLFYIASFAFFALQVPIFLGDLKKEYPEDYKKYIGVFVLYEIILLSVFLFLSTVTISIGTVSAILDALVILVALIIFLFATRMFFSRKYCFGTVISKSSGGYVAVRVESDLLSKVSGAEYAVSDPRGIKAKAGARVKLLLRKSGGSSHPVEIIEELK